METYARTCRFILSCNYSSKIIDPIQSRCAIYRFRPLTQTAIGEEIRRIAKAERLTVTRDAIEAIAYVAQGDMRRAINALQGAAMVSDEVDESMVYASTATARPDEIRELLCLVVAGEFNEAEGLLRELMYDRGIAPGELLGQCYRTLIKQPMHRELKVELIEHLGETDFRLSEGGTPERQMEALLARCVRSASRYG
jgi:replication factor C small subunit